MNHRRGRANSVAVRQDTALAWAWEVVDGDGVTIAEGKAWTYSDAVTRAWHAERSAQMQMADFRV